MEVADIALRPGVDPVEVLVGVLLLEVPEDLLPLLMLPEIIGIVHGMPGFVAKDLDEFLIGRGIAFELSQFRWWQGKRGC